MRLARLPFGLGLKTRVRRGGIVWDLDLSEGIDLAIYLLGAFEHRTVRVFGRLVHPGMTVVDVGANVGAHTLQLARMVGPEGRVIACEPTVFAHRKLLANLAANPSLAARVRPTQALLVDHPGEAAAASSFSSWPLTGGGSATHPVHAGRAMPTDGCQVRTLDAHLAAEGVAVVDVMKIDVDGHECAVLRGAVETLGRLRPAILFELAPYTHVELGHDPRQCFSLLEELGYSFHDEDLRALGVGAAALPELAPPAGSRNIIALHDRR